MTVEELVKAGLTEDQAKAVLKLHKEAIDGNYIPRDTFESERTKVKNLTEQVKERDTQITELGKFKGTAEELQKKVTTLEIANQTAQANYNKEIAALEKRGAITAEITNKVYDVNDVIEKLDLEKVTVKDGKVVSGLEDQVTALKTSKPHWFKSEDAPNDESQKFGGFIFNKTPPKESKPEQHENGSKTEAAKFGEFLAAEKMGTNSIAEKAAKKFFQN